MGIRLFAPPTRFAQCRRGSIVHTRVLGSYVEIQKNAEELGENWWSDTNECHRTSAVPAFLFRTVLPAPHRSRPRHVRSAAKMLAVTPMQLDTGDLQRRVYGHAQTPHRQPQPRTCKRCPDGAAGAYCHTFAILQAAQISSSFLCALSKSKSSIDEARDLSRSPSTVPDRASVTT